MAVFIRKFKEGGSPTDYDWAQPQELNVNSEVQSPKFVIGNYQIDVDSFYNDLERNFQTFRNMYEGTWTNKEREEILRDHDLFLRNLKAGNILGIDDAGRFSIVDAQNSGIDFSLNGSWGRYSYFVKQIADAEKRLDTTSSTPKKKFTNTSIIEDIYNNFFGGSENPDYKSFFDLDEVVDDGNGNKVRGVRNRVNALLDLLDENYLSKFDDADESFGGLEGVKTRIDRLRNALADGTLDNEDFASASALGLNLRGLLSTDGNLKFDDKGNLLQEETTPEATAQTETEELQELVYGNKKLTTRLLIDKIKGWDPNISTIVNIGATKDFRNEKYLLERMKKMHEDPAKLYDYYKTEFFPAFFEKLKIYTPEYINDNPNETVSTWLGPTTPLAQYIRENLTLAIRNKLYGSDKNILPDYIRKDLNQIVGTNFWTVPGSFNEDTGTILAFNPDTGEYKRLSIYNQNLKFVSPVDNKPHTFLEDYVYGLTVTSAKKGAKLQLGGNINSLALPLYTEDLYRANFINSFTPQAAAAAAAVIDNPELKKTHATDKIIGEGSVDFETEDYARLISLGADLVSLAGGYAGLGGGAVSTISDIVGDMSDESLTGWDVAKNAGVNAAWTVAGLVPGVKLGKIGKTLLKWGPRGIALLNAVGLVNAENYDALKRMFTTGEVTSEDLNLLTQIGRAITGAVGMGKAIKREHIYRKGDPEVIGKRVKVQQEGSDDVPLVDLNNAELSEINTVGRNRGQKAANEKLQEILKRNGWQEENAKKTTLKEDVFGEGTVNKAKNKLQRKQIDGENIFSEVDQAHYNYINEKYGKWMGLENEGRGVFSSKSNSGLRERYNKAKDRLYGDSEYDRRIAEIKARNTNLQEDASSRNVENNEGSVHNEENVVNNNEENIVRNEENIVRNEESVHNEGENVVHNEGENGKPSEKVFTVNPELSRKEQIDAILTKYKSKLQQNERNNLKSLRKNNGKHTPKWFTDLLNEIKKGEELDKGRFATKATNDVANNIETSKYGSKLQAVIQLKKSGGILKGQSGLSKENFYDLYKYKKLGNEELKTHNQNANKSQLNDHNNDFGLLKSYQKNEAYTSNSDLVRSDLQNYFTQGKFDSLLKFVDEYNNDARLIRLFWDNPHMANTEHGDPVRSHNRRFKKMFASRSQSNNENSAYNIGYQDNIEDVMGTSTWMRRMDRYKDQFDVNNPILSRIHKIDLGNGNFGYVYKKANGDIDILNNDVAERILNNQSNNQKLPEDNTQIPGVNEQTGDNTPGNDWDWDLASILGGDSGVGTRKQIDLYKYLPATLAFGRMLGDIDATNRRTRRYLSQLQNPLLSPWDFRRQVYGDYGSLKYAEDLAALVQSQMNRPLTSNATLSMLGRLEAAKLAAEQRWKGYLADNQMIHKTYEQSAAEEKENTKRRTDVANVNRGLMADAARTRAGIVAASDAANHNSLDAWLMNYVEKPIQEEAYKRQAYQDWYDYIAMGPMDYDFTGDPILKDFSDLLASISDSDPQRDAKRNAILNQAANYRAWKAKDYRLAQLAKFRQMKPYIQQKFPLDDYGTYYTTGVATPTYVARSGGSLETKTKKSKDSSYPTAVIRAKSKDNDRLIKLILEVIKNHKDLAKGVRMTDYSKYIIKDLK